MTIDSTQPRRPLRLWPGVVGAILLLAARFGIPVALPEQTIWGVIGGFAGALAVLVWWLFFSRAPWTERLCALALMIVGLAVTWPLVDVSISTGAMGGLLPMLAVPTMTVALVAWAVASRQLSSGSRRATMVATLLLACGAWTLAKTGGFTTSFDNDLMWRWAQTREERLVADPAAALPPAAPPAAPTTPPIPETGGHTVLAPANAAVAMSITVGAEAVSPTAAAPATSAAVPFSEPSRNEWHGFRGQHRDSIVRGSRIETDWAKTPPVSLWRRPIGPGWSSFAVHGDLLYTQEQRGEDEIVTSYELQTGKPVWSHRDAVRFWESNGGAGPRATPTFSDGRIYAFGATGLLNVLDARSGALMWSHDVAGDTRTPVPTWGFSGSPLVVDDLVIVSVSGTLAAYEIATGKARWVGPHHELTSTGAYSSPQRMTIDGVDQVVLLSEAGATSVSPKDGVVLWEHRNATTGGAIIQPALTADGDLLYQRMDMAGGLDLHRVKVTRGAAGWTTEERWTSTSLKPMFNDFVIHHGYAYGFDGSILACLDLQDGKRKWKGGRYGSGQLMLLADQDVLLVVSEEGELALVGATPDGFKQIARVPAIEGKTWNHPVLVGDLLLVRNGEEMAAFRLAPQGR
jgi:outer membrane protein assembly factor BamB